jgi:hypothetical protein
MNLVRIVRQTSVLASIVLTSLLIYSNPASAQQRSCVITDEGTTVCGKLTTQTKKPNSSSGQRKEVDKFVFLLKGCKRSDTTIKCNLQVTNKGSERELYIHAGNEYSTIVDSLGKAYSGSTVDIGGKSSNALWTVISPGIDYNADISFENIPEQIAQAPVLNLYLHSQKVQFRNVSFSN